ncbi:dihydrolipoamide acetyltransferase domain protein [Helicobacter pylori Hp A-27]|nr:dihydrolipoamide acetyltransferase domain protein [Helicobacter pylori Hp A-27]
MQNSSGACLNLQEIASTLRPFLEKLDANIIEAIEENEEFNIEGFENDFKIMLFDRDGGRTISRRHQSGLQRAFKILKRKDR